jgi:hypothetical protein
MMSYVYMYVYLYIFLSVCIQYAYFIFIISATKNVGFNLCCTHVVALCFGGREKKWLLTLFTEDKLQEKKKELEWVRDWVC